MNFGKIILAQIGDACLLLKSHAPYNVPDDLIDTVGLIRDCRVFE
jgi:hypothetical protein